MRFAGSSCSKIRVFLLTNCTSRFAARTSSVCGGKEASRFNFSSVPTSAFRASHYICTHEKKLINAATHFGRYAEFLSDLIGDFLLRHFKNCLCDAWHEACTLNSSWQSITVRIWRREYE